MTRRAVCRLPPVNGLQPTSPHAQSPARSVHRQYPKSNCKVVDAWRLISKGANHGGLAVGRETRIEHPGNDMKEMTMTTFKDRFSTVTITLAAIALVALVSFGVAASLAPLIV